MSKLSRSERTPHGLTPCQPPQTCLRPGQIGQVSPTEAPTVKMEKAEVPRVTAIPCTMVPNKPQNNKLICEDHSAPFAKWKKKVKRTGTVTEAKAGIVTSTPKSLNTPKPMTFLIGFLSRLGLRKNRMREWNV